MGPPRHLGCLHIARAVRRRAFGFVLVMLVATGANAAADPAARGDVDPTTTPPHDAETWRSDALGEGTRFRAPRRRLLAPARAAPVSLDVNQRPARHGEVQLFSRRTLLALQAAADANQDDGLVPDLELDEEALEEVVPPGVDISGLPRARGLQREARVFWYTMGASAIASLLVRVIAVIPVVIAVAAGSSLTAFLGPAATLALFVALGVSLLTVDAAVASLAATVTFDSMSAFFSSRYLASFSGHFLGNALAVGVVGLISGFAIMLIAGITALADFAGMDIAVAFSLISAFGALPGFPLAFFAGFALPAILGAWSTAASAEAAEGFVIDSGWFPLEGSLTLPGDAGLPHVDGPVRGGTRRARVLNPQVRIPGT